MTSTGQTVPACDRTPTRRSGWFPAALVVFLSLVSGCALYPRSGAAPGAPPEPVVASGEEIHQVDELVDKPGGSLVLPDSPHPPETDAGVFTLRSAVAYALEHNPRIEVAKAALDRAGGQEVAAFAPFLPEVDLFSRAGGTSETLSPGAPGPVGGILASSLDEAHQFAQAEVDLQWTLWDFGRRAGSYGRASNRRQIASLELLRAQQTIVYDTAAAFLAVLLARANTIIQEKAVRRADAVLQDARVRNENGVADKDNVLRAEVQLSVAQEGVVLARQSELDALARLNYVLGRNPSLPLRVVEAGVGPSFDRPLTDCLQTAAAERPEIRAGRAEVAAANHGLQSAEGDFYPKIYVRLGVGNISGEGVRTGWHEGGSLHLDQRFYTGGLRQGALQSAEADIRAAVSRTQGILDAVTLEVNLAYRAMIASRDRIRLAEPAIAEARENLRLVRVKYGNGNATPTDIVDAETTATRSEQRYALAVYDYLGALARLEFAMGASTGCLASTAESAEPGPESTAFPGLDQEEVKP